MKPDLNYEWFSGKYIPHTIDVENIDFCWKDNNIFGHSPSSPEKKATYLLEEAMLVLEAKWPKIFEEWSFDLIQGVSFEECMRRKRKASVFFDQAGRHRVANLGIQDVIGWYGNSAVEAMAFGIPTMAHLSDHAFDGADRAGVNIRDNPVINIEPTRNSLLAAFLQITGQTHEERRQLAERTRRYAEEFHGYEAVAESLTAAYDELRSSTRSGNKELCLARP
jgi:glycosyltransferase involved in cell wall biosynthesis